MSHNMVIVTYPQTGMTHSVSNAKLVSDQEKILLHQQGFLVEEVSYEEYVRRSDEQDALEKAERHARHAAMDWLNLKGLAVPLNSIPKEGLRVRFRTGECFGRKIEWQDVQEGTIIRSSDCNSREESGIELLDSNGRSEGGFAGWISRSKTWFQYKEEAEPGAYREHCAQIISIIVPEATALTH
jgi:hypothetical protein